MRFQKAAGTTPSEKLLAELCAQSFLSLWSYPNLYRKPGKELTDLLVVFGEDVLLFSDKSCAFPSSGDLPLDWRRWHRRSILDSARQLHRAEEWIKRSPERVFLDPKGSVPLPVPLPPPDRLRVHRICVALGASGRALEETGKPFLTVSTTATGEDASFVIGPVPGTNVLIHVLDEFTLPVLLSEFSTTPDFLEYLRKKEELFASGRFAFAESELDLLAYFLWNGRSFPMPDAMPFRLEANLWPKVSSDPHFLAGRKENEVSVFWDGLIEYLNDLYLKEELEHGNELAVADHERVVRIMAGETRFARRLLTKWILERADLAKNGYVGSYFPSMQEGVLYVLLIGPGDGGRDHADYRQGRQRQLHMRCIAAKAIEPARRFIVGIALDARGVKGSSEDFVYLDTDGWTAEDIRNAERLRQERGYFIKGRAKETHVSEAEYPGT